MRTATRLDVSPRILPLILAATALASGPASRASELPFSSAATLAMGGASVGIADGADSMLTNPAALGVLPGWEISLPLLNIGIEQHNGLLASLSDLEGILGDGRRFGALSGPEREQVVAILRQLGEDRSAAAVTSSAGVAGKFRNFGFALVGQSGGTSELNIDLERLNAVNPNAQDGLARNGSAVSGASLTTMEIRGGYAHSLFATSTQHQLWAGGALRIVRGSTSSFHTVLQDIGLEGGGYRPELFGVDTKASWGMDLDLGVLYGFGKLGRAGLVVRGVLDPSFAVEAEEGYAGPAELSSGRQVRMGVGLTPGAGLRVAADVDLTSNHASLSRIGNQQFGFGVEKSFSGWALRGGFLENLAEPDGVTFTGGLRRKGLDLTLAYSPRDGLFTCDQLHGLVTFRIDHLTKPEGM